MVALRGNASRRLLWPMGGRPVVGVDLNHAQGNTWRACADGAVVLELQLDGVSRDGATFVVAAREHEGWRVGRVLGHLERYPADQAAFNGGIGIEHDLSG